MWHANGIAKKLHRRSFLEDVMLEMREDWVCPETVLPLAPQGNSIQNSSSARKPALANGLCFLLPPGTELAPSRMGRSPAPTVGRFPARGISLVAVLQTNFTVLSACKIIVHNFDTLSDQRNRLAWLVK